MTTTFTTTNLTSVVRSLCIKAFFFALLFVFIPFKLHSVFGDAMLVEGDAVVCRRLNVDGA